MNTLMNIVDRFLFYQISIEIWAQVPVGMAHP